MTPAGAALRLAAVLAATMPLAGCTTLGYYAQSVSGQLDLLWRRQPVAELLDDRDTPATLRERLRTAAAMREFASAELSLPRDGAYSSYVELGRPYVVWTVVVAPPLSLEPRSWCFPVAGCVAYRGYFDREAAWRFAATRVAEGDDVYVGGVGAYSTLGWFDDPLLSSMLGGEDFDLAGVLFHELAHRRLYLPGDSAFNEAFAVTVEREGARRWLALHGDAGERVRYAQALRRRDFLVGLLLEWRDRLQALYEGPLDEARKLAGKARLLAALQQAHARAVAADPGLAGAERWLADGLNNAKLASVATYHGLVPAFERLLAESDGDLQAFYAACEALAGLDETARAASLQRLAGAR